SLNSPSHSVPVLTQWIQSPSCGIGMALRISRYCLMRLIGSLISWLHLFALLTAQQCELLGLGLCAVSQPVPQYREGLHGSLRHELRPLLRRRSILIGRLQGR